jgi:hypothetical protein
LGENGVPVLVSSEKLFARFKQEAYQKLAATVKKKDEIDVDAMRAVDRMTKGH